MSTIVQTGFKLAQTVISNGATTGNEWSNPNDLLLTDGDLSESNPGVGVASDVVIGNFLAQVPGNAVITGIELQIIGKAGAQTSPVLTLTPVALDNTSGSDIFYPYITPYTGLTPTLGSHFLGSPTYLFATAWTPDMINNFKLQLIANGDLYIDSALLNVFYYIPDEITPVVPTGDSCDDCNSPVQAQPFYLSQPFLSSDRYAYLKSFNYPDGTPIQYADLGSCGGFITLVFDPAVPKVGTENFEENAKTAVWETMPDGTVRLDFNDIDDLRGLQFHTPYEADPALRSNHGQNSKVIISDSAPFLGQYLQRCQIGALVSAPVEVDSEGTLIAKPVVKFNFTGGGVVPTQDLTDPEQVNINIPGSGTTSPVIVDSNSATSGNTQVPSLTFSLTSSGVNRAVVVQVSTEQSKTITGITFNGVALTRKVFQTDAGNNLRTEQWILVAPILGTHNVVVSLSAAAYVSAGAEMVVGVDQSTSTGSISDDSGTSTTPSTTLITTYDNSIIVSSLVTAVTPILYTPGAGQVANWFRTANSDTRQGGSALEVSGSAPDSVILNYTITQNTNWCMTGLEIKGISAAAPVISGVTTQDTGAGVVVPNTTLLEFPTGSVTNPLPGKAKIAFPTVLNNKVSVSNTDTTPGFLDPKLNIHSSNSSVSVTKTITNPAGNEVLDYDLIVSLSGASIFPQDLFVEAGSTNFSLYQVTSDPATGVMFITYTPNGGITPPRIVRFQRDSSGYYYKTHSVNVTISEYGNNPGGASAAGGVGLSVIGTFLYVSYATSGNVAKLTRYLAADLTGETAMTYSGTAPSAAGTSYNTSYTNGTDLYIQSTGTTWYRYTISGTTATNAETITQVSTVFWSTSDGTNVYLSTENGLFTTGLITKTNLTGGGSSSENRPNMFPIFPTNNMAGLVFANSTQMYMVSSYIPTNATVALGMNLKLIPINKF